ncbi:MAG: RNA methyltransferase [Bacteroidales bacterium]|nr:RNA methyltransferase [Bacteroidales bacterium]
MSLQKRKVREEYRLFIAEGDKIVREILASGLEVKTLVCKPEYLAGIPSDVKERIEEILPVKYEELKQLSSLSTPHNAMAVVRMTEHEMDMEEITRDIIPALDFIQDPGNMGTIIRAAGWFGIKNMVCSLNCVDIYNPKVIQATMGAFLNVKVHVCDLSEFLSSAQKKEVPVYGTVLDGESVYNHSLGRRGIILIGNESRGISEELLTFVTDRITIPKFTDSKYGIESLNAGMAASIIFSEFRRRG